MSNSFCSFIFKKERKFNLCSLIKCTSVNAKNQNTFSIYLKRCNSRSWNLVESTATRNISRADDTTCIILAVTRNISQTHYYALVFLLVMLASPAIHILMKTNYLLYMHMDVEPRWCGGISECLYYESCIRGVRSM